MSPNAFTRFSLFATSVMMLTAVSCVGPVGPQGPQGRDGRDGNANVWSINYLAIESDWYGVGTAGDPGYFLALDLNVPEITTDIVNNGVVMVYYRETDGSPWVALPYTFISHDPEYIEKLDFIYDLSFVGMQSQASDRQATPYAGTYRVIVATAVPLGKKDIDWSDYDTVAEYLGVDEDNQTYRMIDKPEKPRQE